MANVVNLPGVDGAKCPVHCGLLHQKTKGSTWVGGTSLACGGSL